MKVTTLAVAGSLLFGAALTGCGGQAGAAPRPGLTVEDKQALGEPLMAAELSVPAVCSANTTRYDPDANTCAAVLTQVTAKIQEAHDLAQQRGIRDPVLDSSADDVARYRSVCDPKGSGASITDCLAAASKIRNGGELYVQKLRSMLDAVK